jgi:dihydrodipicolinate synthase/N-acetylneuraminate lyase
MADVRGVYAAAITPRGEQDEVDFGAAFELLDFLAKAGVDGIALFTGAGEYAALSVEERSRLVYLAVKRSRVPVLVGVGSATLHDSVELARAARDAGAAGLLLPPPYFFRYQQDDLCEFYLQFAACVDSGAATFLSNHPIYASAIETETVRALLSTGRFAGIEDASGDPQTFACIQAAAAAPACVLVGSDPFLANAIRAGAQGAISGVAGAAPELVMALVRAIQTGNQPEAERLERRMGEFLAWCQEFPQPAILRAAAELRGIETGGLAAPLSASRQKRLEKFREWFPAWLRG